MEGLIVVCLVALASSSSTVAASHLEECLYTVADVHEEQPFQCENYTIQGPNLETKGVDLLCRSETKIAFEIGSSIGYVAFGTANEPFQRTEMVNGSYFTARHLAPDTKYQFKFWLVDGELIRGPYLTDWISTQNNKSWPLDIKTFTYDKLSLLMDRSFSTVLRWSPAEDMRCFYEIVIYDGEDYTQKEVQEPLSLNSVNISSLKLDTEYIVSIRAKSENWKMESNTTYLRITTPTCLQIYESLKICRPENIEGLNVTEQSPKSSSKSKLPNVLVSWKPPKYAPDYYLVHLIKLDISRTSNSTKLLLNITGSQSKAVFLGVASLYFYQVSVQAFSEGGAGKPAHAFLQVLPEQVALPEDNATDIVWYIGVAILLLFLIAIVIGGSMYGIHKYDKEQRSTQRNNYFSDLEQKCTKLPEVMLSDIVSDKPDKWELSPERLVLQTFLGQGAFGVVRKGLLCAKDSTQTEVAVKMLKENPTTDELRAFRHEIEIMKCVGAHPHLVSIIGCCTEKQLMLVCEYCALGDLQNYLRVIWNQMTARDVQKESIRYADLSSSGNDSAQDISESTSTVIVNQTYELVPLNIATQKEDNRLLIQPQELLSFARQIALGMEYLSELRVLHRDLAARNVLVCSDKTVKVADFGLSRDVYKDNVYKKKGAGKLPVRWMALESITHQIYTSQSDVWSFGIVLWEIVTLGGNPYPGVSTRNLLAHINQGYRMECPANCSNELYSLMSSCWKARPKDRPTFLKIREELDSILESVTPAKYLTLNIMMDEFSSLREPVRSVTSIVVSKKSSSSSSSERYIRPIGMYKSSRLKYADIRQCDKNTSSDELSS